MDKERERDSEAGIALLAVMIGLAIISVLAIGLVLASKTGVQQAHADLGASERRAFFDAIIVQTAVDLLDLQEADRPRVDGVPQAMDVLGQTVRTTVTSEFGKVDVNVADAATLTALFEAADEGPSIAAEEANQVVSWRGGAEGNAVRHFRTISELTQVQGISMDLYRRILPSITVYSARGRIDQSTAPLLALQAVPGIDRLTAEAIIRDRLQGQTVQAGELVNGRIQQGTNITGWAFRIDSDFGLVPNREHAAAVIRMTGDPVRPFLVLWRDETAD